VEKGFALQPLYGDQLADVASNMRRPMSLIPIPIRFENILTSPALEPAPLLVGVEEDLQFFDRLRRRAQTQQSGVMAFPIGSSGDGKTTAVYAASALLPDLFEQVFVVPATIQVREVVSWLAEHLPAQGERTTIVRMDGREASDDRVGLKQLMSGLNQLLRGRPDLVVCWPTVYLEWRNELVELARTIGGKGLCPEGFETFIGPPKEAWPDVLDRILIQLDHTLDDVALEQSYVSGVAEHEANIGRFLETISGAIAERVDDVQLTRRLPRLVFVITSTSEVVGEANRLRQAGSYLLKSRELTSYSPKSESGKWWAARAGTPEHQLGYVIALFRARLVTMTPSSVVYSSLQHGDEGLRSAARDNGMKPSTTNASTTFKNTDFYRLLIGEPSTELTSTIKGKTAATTLAAHTAIQALSAKRHKAINQSICQLAEVVVPEFKASLGAFEVDLGERDTFTDAVIPLDGDDLHLEFHHLSQAHCRASSMAAYIMEKLRTYAWRHHIIPR
jgi:hypothetical protein